MALLVDRELLLWIWRWTICATIINFDDIDDDNDDDDDDDESDQFATLPLSVPTRFARSQPVHGHSKYAR